MLWYLRLLAALAFAFFGLATAQIRLTVSLTPEEFQTFEPALKKLQQAKGWQIEMDNLPQAGTIEKITAQIASNSLADVVRLSGSVSQLWIQQGAFLDLSNFITRDKLSLADFYQGPLAQFRYQGKPHGLPDTAAPDVVFYNKAMFDAAGVAYPTDRWTYEDMAQAAIKLTLDTAGRNPAQAGFDPKNIKQWGWNGGLTFFWQRHIVRAFGGDVCANPDCTLMNWTSPQVQKAITWWANLTQKGATLYDPYGGSQTGIPGDPFFSNKAAMGYNGFFLVGQLKNSPISYDIVQPFVGVNGRRFTPLTTNGYFISSRSKNPEAAWALVKALLEPEFLRTTWGLPGHSVPVRRTAARSILSAKGLPANAQAVVAAMNYAEVYMPFTPSAVEVYGKTVDLFKKAMTGELSPAEAGKKIETEANAILARDRK